VIRILDQVNYHHRLAHGEAQQGEQEKKMKRKKGKKNTLLSMCICMCLFFLHRTERICVAATQTTIDFWDTKVYDEQRKGKHLRV